MKKCPFCAEEIQDEALKCKHCGEFLDAKPKASAGPWYHRNSALVIAFVCVGPLALPLVWFNPKFSLVKKAIITAVCLILTYFMTLYTIDAVKKLMETYKQLSGTL